jgi:hypothetical protein
MWSEFYYDESSPTCLRWAINVWTGFQDSVLLVQKDAVAGSVGSRCYRIKLRGVQHPVHKIIYEMFNGEVPEGYIVDHEDGNWRNNFRSNLRAIPLAVNNRNTKMNFRNTSGVCGVNYHSKSDSWQAGIKTLDGKRRYKSYSVGTYGDAAFHLACQWREEQILQLNAQGAGYTNRHGKA